jgi:WD40 repeat protein
MLRMKRPLPDVQEHGELELRDFPVAAAWSPTQPVLAVALSTGRVVLIDAVQSRVLHDWQAHGDSLQKLVWHPQGMLLSTTDQRSNIKHWSLTAANGSVNEAAAWHSTNTWIEACMWRPDGQFLAVASGKQCDVFDAKGDLAQTLTFPHSAIADVAWNPRGTELALSGYQGVDLYSGIGKTLRRRFLPWAGALQNLSWSPNGKILSACRQDNALHFWRVQTGKHAAMSGYPTKPRALAWSSDSRYLVTGGSPSVITWTFAQGGPEGKAPVELQFHLEPVSAVAVDARQHYVAAGCRAQRISLWESPVAALPFFILDMKDAVEFVGWQAQSDLCSWLAALDRSGHLGLWKVNRPA